MKKTKMHSGIRVIMLLLLTVEQHLIIHDCFIADSNPGPTSEWFFENLTDLQRKLFLGASRKHGVPRLMQVPDNGACSNSSKSTSLPPG